MASSQQSFGGDDINQLPVDPKALPTHNEINLVNSLFTQEPNTLNKIFIESKDCMIIGLLFIMLSLPQIDDMINKLVPMTTNSIYIMVGIKAVIMMVLFWLIKHFYLSRKDSSF